VALLHHHRSTGLLAGLLCLALAAPAVAAGPANVSVRIEGAGATLREEAPVTTTTDGVNKDGTNTCTGTSAAGALERATNGDWNGSYMFGSYGVERIFAETHSFDDPSGAYWSFWVNDRPASQGVCNVELQEGDDVLFYVDRCFNAQPPDYACQNDPVYPLELRVPASATAGTPAELTVVRHEGSGATTTVDEARITGDGVDVTTKDGGRATVSFPRAGTFRLKASKDGSARSAAEVVTVVAPGQAPPAPVVTADESAPVARIAGIREKQRFSRKKAPRTLRGSVAPDPSGLRAVKLSLTRSAGGRCQLYSPSKERFRSSRCGRRVNFSIGDRQDWSYLLPKRLGKGRYVLDVIAVDKLGNRDTLARGRNRVVFLVR
jgi:hypothetical protein